MKTRQVSLLRVLSVMVLLLFAAPMMDGVLTLFQNESFDETTRRGQIALFEMVAYADHDGDPPTSLGQKAEHLLSTAWETCGKCGAKLKEVGTIGIWVAIGIAMEGGAITYVYNKQKEENRTLQERPHPIEQCIPPPDEEEEEEEDPPPDDGGNDGGNDND